MTHGVVAEYDGKKLDKYHFHDRTGWCRRRDAESVDMLKGDEDGLGGL